MNTPELVAERLWGPYPALREVGLSASEYLEELTLLLLLKIEHEQTEAPWGRSSIVPKPHDWMTLLAREGEDLLDQYRSVLAALGDAAGLLGFIFRGSRARITDPKSLRHLIVDVVDRERWMALAPAERGEVYQRLLHRWSWTLPVAARQAPPVALARAMAEVLQPRFGETVGDPACGIGTLMIEAHGCIVREHPVLEASQRLRLATEDLRAAETDGNLARLAAMNLLMHGIGTLAAGLPLRIDHAPGFGQGAFDVILSHAATGAEAVTLLERVPGLLRQGGRAALVVPDAALVDGGAAAKARKQLLQETNLHTLLRLPAGISSAPGVRANVLFFDREPRGRAKKSVWVYDLRTSKHFTARANPIVQAEFDDFVGRFSAADRSRRQATWSKASPHGRWRAYSQEQVLRRADANLDITWLQEGAVEAAGELPQPDLIAAAIVEDLRAALALFEEIRRDSGKQR